jgi:HEAT repeat protein
LQEIIGFKPTVRPRCGREEGTVRRHALLAGALFSGLIFGSVDSPGAQPEGENVKTLIEGLHDKDPVMRTACALGRIGPPAKDAVPALIDRLYDARAADLRPDIAEALGGVGPAAKDGVPVLTSLLRNGPSNVRCAAAAALGNIGAAAEDSVPALMRLRGYDSPEGRRSAAQALSQIRAAADPQQGSR